MKKVEHYPVGRNSEVVKQWRADFYASLIAEYALSTKIYVDETGMNLHLSRKRGWAPVGDTCAVEVPTQQGINCTLLLAVSPTLGRVHHWILHGGCTKELYHLFMSEVYGVPFKQSCV